MDFGSFFLSNKLKVSNKYSHMLEKMFQVLPSLLTSQIIGHMNRLFNCMCILNNPERYFLWTRFQIVRTICKESKCNKNVTILSPSLFCCVFMCALHNRCVHSGPSPTCGELHGVPAEQRQGRAARLHVSVEMGSAKT